jgi:hypothetical protein
MMQAARMRQLKQQHQKGGKSPSGSGSSKGAQHQQRQAGSPYISSAATGSQHKSHHSSGSSSPQRRSYEQPRNRS